MSDDVRETIIAELEKGRSLLSICKDEGMPSARTVQRWQNDDADFDVAVTRAREDGFHYLAEQARIHAHAADDAAKGRLAFDADRWYLGKLSNAFSDNKAQKHEVTHDLSDKAKAWLGIS
jgi:hypothetical protein